MLSLCPRRSNSAATGFRCTTWLEDVGWCMMRKLSPFEECREVRKQKNAADVIHIFIKSVFSINTSRIDTFENPITHSKLHFSTSDTALYTNNRCVSHQINPRRIAPLMIFLRIWLIITQRCSREFTVSQSSLL